MSAASAEDKITVGRVVSAHGINGEISIVPTTDYPERFLEMERAELYRDGKFLCELCVCGARFVPSNGRIIIDAGLEDRSAAEACVGAEILVEPDERVNLPPDTFWIDDLIGLTVEDTDGRALGVVSDFIDAGGNELYEVQDYDGGLHYIPAVEEFIREVTPENGRIVVSLIDGLWD